MPKVALIYPYFRTRSENELLFPPLGAAFLASQLHYLGIEARIFDCTFESFENILEKVREYNPEIIGIYSMVTLKNNAIKFAKRFKVDNSGILLAAGGPLPTLYPEQYCEYFDVIFRGEAELSFPHFCVDYFDLKLSKDQLTELDLEKYSGLFIKNHNQQFDNQIIHYDEREIANFPLPYREDFEHSEYIKFWQGFDGSKTTSIMTTFGCPFNCDFCSRPVFGDQFRRRSVDVIFKEIDEVISMGYDTLWIADDNFTLDIQFLKEFCQRMSQVKIRWNCLSRVTGINEEIVDFMKKGGCKRVYLGLESGNQTTLKLMKKQATLEEGLRAVQLFHVAGIEVAAFFIVGYPGETVESIEDTFRYALELPIDIISFNIPFPLPGSRLYERLGEIDENLDWNVENEVTFVYKTEFDPNWIKSRISQTMQLFAEKKNGKQPR